MELFATILNNPDYFVLLFSSPTPFLLFFQLKKIIGVGGNKVYLFMSLFKQRY